MWKKTFMALGLVAGAAVAITLLPNFAPEVAAGTPPHVTKGDRLDLRPLGSQCSERGWPYFEAACLRDRRQQFGEARAVRVVTADRPALRMR
jgi:hypothetical protein